MAALNDAAAKFEIPGEVSGWLGRLVLLYGIPFHYLIPDEKMLPPESIRFFYVDPIWIQCLVQGACSVGNTDYGSNMIDSAMNTLVQPNVPAGSKDKPATNKAAASVRDRLRDQYEGVPMPNEPEDLDWPLTGFLLRSAAVKGWRGLEIMACKTLTPEQKASWPRGHLNDEQKEKLEKESVAPIKALRIEQLASDVMLGLFNGVIAQLVIRQPQEGLHFGLTRGGDSFGKRLRAIKTGDMLTAEAIPVTPVDGRINVGALAEAMKAQLGDQLEAGKFTSAEFAVEMIEAPGEFTFKPGRPL